MNKMYSVYDVRAKMYSSPMMFNSDALAIRDVAMACQEGSMLHKFPEDYSLFCLGEFDDEAGEFVVEEGYPLKVATMTEIKNMMENK